jgi:capsular exopolysaccharide synthesis family protein
MNTTMLSQAKMSNLGRVRDSSELVLRAIRKRWLAALSIAGLVIVATAFYTVGQKRIYRATATVLIDANPPKPLGKDVQAVVDIGAGTFWSSREYQQTQFKLIRSRAVAQDTVSALSLHNDKSFLQNLPPGAKAKPTSKELSIEEVAVALISRLSVEPIRDSRLVVVNIDDANPERARRILATHLDTYLQRNVDFAVSSTQEASEWLRGQVDSLKTELEKTELALHDYKKEKRILSVSIDDQSNMLRGEMSQLNDALTRASARREEVQSRLDQLSKVDPSNPTELPATELLSSAILQHLRQQHVDAFSAFESAKGGGKGEKYPEVEAIRARVEVTRQALMAEVRNVQGALAGDLAAVTKEASGIARLFEHAKQRALDLNMLEIEYRRLERTKNNTEKLYGLVMERSKESDITGMMRFNNIRIVEEPMKLGAAVSPRVPLNLALGSVLGLLVGFGLVVARELLDRRVRTPDDVESDVGIPVLGVLPPVDGKARSRGPYYGRHARSRKGTADPALESRPELIAHVAPSSNTAEMARAIRTSLTFASPDKPQRIVLVTSGSPGEGKTMVASTVAITFAQAGHRTILIDCDLRRSRVHRIYGKVNDIGVSSAMQEPSQLDSTVLATEIPNLWVLPAGPRVPNPAELLQSEKFHTLLELLKGKFDRVIIDSPPVTAVTDGVIVAARADAVVFVIRANATLRSAAHGSVRSLREVGAPLAGCVLNCFEPNRKGYSYYYRYYGASEYTGKA